MSNPYPEVYVIIVTYNGARWIRNCLHSLESSAHPCTIVVVDNASTDETLDLVKGFENVVLIPQLTNVGFGKANNIGIEYALRQNAKFLYLVNQDTTVERDCISHLLKAATTSSFAILSPVHWDSSGQTLDKGFASYVRGSLSAAQLQHAAARVENAIIPVDFVNAAAWFIPVSTIQNIGGFAPLFFHYGEDRDYIHRLSYFQLKIAVTTKASIRHFRDDRNLSIAEWTDAKKQRYYFVGMLSRVSNINMPLIPAWVKAISWLLKESLVLVSKGDFYALIRVVSIVGKVLKIVPRIAEHRREVLKQSSYKFLTCASE